MELDYAILAVRRRHFIGGFRRIAIMVLMMKMQKPGVVSRSPHHRINRKIDLLAAAAARQYELIKRKNGDHVTMLQLGGRLVPADMKAVGTTPSISTPVSEEQYLALVDKFFDEADTHRKPGDRSGSGELDADELGSSAGKKLIGLLQ